MLKRLGKLTLLTVGMLMVFISCTDDTNDTPPEEAKDFIDFASMEGYFNPIIQGMKLNLAPANDIRRSGDLLDSSDNKSVIYTYIDQPVKTNNTEAVYKFGDEQFFGVEITGTGNSRQLKFVFEKSPDGKSGFFISSAAVTFNSELTINTIPVVVDNFTNLAIGGGYKFLDQEFFSISGNDMIDDDNHTLFTYNNRFIDNKTHAVYQSTSVVNSNQFVGVILTSTTTSRTLDFYVAGTAQNPEYFATAEAVTFNTKATQSMPANSFLDNAAGRSFQLVIDFKDKVTKLANDGDILFKGTTYKYVSSTEPLQAVYKVAETSKFFGVVINEDTLDFYLDNSSNTAAYWTVESDVKFVQGAEAILAARTPDGSFIKGVPSGNVTDVADQVPDSGKLSGVYKNSQAYLLADNKSKGNAGTLFIGTVDSIGPIGTSSQVAANAVANIIPHSLQVLGATPYIISPVVTEIKMFDKEGEIIDVADGFVSNFPASSYAIGTSTNGKTYLATNNNVKQRAQIRELTGAGMGSEKLLATTNLIPTSVTGMGTEVYVAGTVGEDVIVNTGTGTSSVIATVTGKDGKLLVLNEVLYLVVRDGTVSKMYKISSKVAYSVTGDSLPAYVESIVADDKYVYVVTRLNGGVNLITSAYTLSDITLAKIADATYVPIIANVVPSLVSLGSDLGVVVFDIETIFGDKVIRYNNFVVSDTPFQMPASGY